MRFLAPSYLVGAVGLSDEGQLDPDLDNVGGDLSAQARRRLPYHTLGLVLM